LKQILPLLAALIVLILTGWLLFFKAAPAPEQPFANQEPSQTSAFIKEDKGQGGVWTQVTLISAKNAAQVNNKPKQFQPEREVAFYVALNTHTVNLSAYQLDKTAVLTTNLGQKLKPLKWESEGMGHHISGFLIFNRYNESEDLLKASKLKLDLGKIAGSKRQFTW
jgi:hypothetical protein